MDRITHRDGERIRGIGGHVALRHGNLKPQQPLNVLLGCTSMTGDAALDCCGGILPDRDTALRGNNERDTTRLSDGERRFHVPAHKRALNGDGVRADALYNLEQAFTQSQEPQLKRVCAFEADHTTLNELVRAAIIANIQRAIARNECSGVDTKDARHRGLPDQAR